MQNVNFIPELASPNVTIFTGEAQQKNIAAILEDTSYQRRDFTSPVRKVSMFDAESCFYSDLDDLGREFDELKEKYASLGGVYPVSTTGIKTETDSIGSKRFCVDSPIIADALTSVIRRTGYPNVIITAEGQFEFLKVANYFRFMEYENGGEHYPHYDSDFRYVIGGVEYRTMQTLVMYFDDCDTGEFCFVEAPPMEVPDLETALRADWTRQATVDEIAVDVPVRCGRIIVFPHELCHTVKPFTDGLGKKRRILRGDLLYRKIG
jgi:hypothetical protein